MISFYYYTIAIYYFIIALDFQQMWNRDAYGFIYCGEWYKCTTVIGHLKESFEL